MQGLSDGYFVLPYTIPNYLAGMLGQEPVPDRRSRVRRGRDRRARPDQPVPVDRRHQVGRPLPPGAGQDHVGQLRHGPHQGEPREGHRATSRRCEEEFWKDVRVLGGDTLNQSLEKAGRVADFLELGELMCLDALHREESCGGHFRVEHQTEDGEALRNDEDFAYVAAWEWTGMGARAECCTRSPSSSSTSTWRSGATSEHDPEPDPQGLAPGAGGSTPGRFETYDVPGVSPDMSFLEMLDVLNDRWSTSARSRSRSSTTAARASAARAG